MRELFCLPILSCCLRLPGQTSSIPGRTHLARELAQGSCSILPSRTSWRSRKTPTYVLLSRWKLPELAADLTQNHKSDWPLTASQRLQDFHRVSCKTRLSLKIAESTHVCHFWSICFFLRGWLWKSRFLAKHSCSWPCLGLGLALKRTGFLHC